MGDADVGSFGDQAVAMLEGVTSELWVVAILFYVGGDLLTTSYGLLNGGVAEVGPVVGPLVSEFGLLVMVPMKLLAIGVGFVIWRLVPEPIAVGVPLGFAVLGVLVTTWNVGVLLVSMRLV